MYKKRTGITTTILSVAVFLAALPFASAGPPAKEQKILPVKGNQGWVNTGIRLLPEDRVTIKATGKVCFSNGEKASCVDADGWGVRDYGTSWPDNWNYCDDPMPAVNHAALIANVGHPDFLVGRRLTFSGKEGTLYLSVNDCTLKGEYWNNGEFSVIVIVERGVVPQR